MARILRINPIIGIALVISDDEMTAYARVRTSSYVLENGKGRCDFEKWSSILGEVATFEAENLLDRYEESTENYEI